jgi:hypothetical protein
VSYPEVYVEISSARFFICRLDKIDRRFVCTTFVEERLDPTIVNRGIIYNMTFLCERTKEFVKDHHLVGAYALVCCPELKRYRGFKKNLTVFQVALSVCKAGLRIDRFFDERILREASLAPAVGGGVQKKK